MEAFGNAKTTRNLNASRYGRTLTLEVNQAGGLCRANLRTYFLERTRVTGVRDPERNYHIFYALLHAHEDHFLPDLPLIRLKFIKLKLDVAPSTFTYLNGSVHHEIRNETRATGDAALLRNAFEALISSASRPSAR